MIILIVFQIIAFHTILNNVDGTVWWAAADISCVSNLWPGGFLPKLASNVLTPSGIQRMQVMDAGNSSTLLEPGKSIFKHFPATRLVSESRTGKS